MFVAQGPGDLLRSCSTSYLLGPSLVNPSERILTWSLPKNLGLGCGISQAKALHVAAHGSALSGVGHALQPAFISSGWLLSFARLRDSPTMVRARQRRGEGVVQGNGRPNKKWVFLESPFLLCPIKVCP